MQIHRNKNRWHRGNNNITIHKETIKTDKQANKQEREKFDKVCCCVCKSCENSKIIAKDFCQHRYYGSRFSFFFLSVLYKTIGKRYKDVYVLNTSGKP